MNIETGVRPFNALAETAPGFENRRGIFHQLSWAHAALALCLITGLVITFASAIVGTQAGFEDRQSGTPLLQAIGLGVYLPTLLFLIARADLPIRTIPASLLIVLLHGLILVSTLWSVEPDATIRRSVALTLEMLFVLHVATWFTPREFIRLMGWVLGAMIIASFLAILVPGLGLTPSGVHAGRMRGIFPTKNVLGEVAAVTAFTCMVLAVIVRDGGRARWLWAGLGLLAAVALYLANSRTPLIALFAAVAAVWAAAFIAFPTRSQQALSLAVRTSIVTMGVLLATIILPAVAAIIITLLGRSMTLSGRTKLWEYAIGKGMDRPWLGAGYKSFWNDKLTFDLRVLHEHWSLDSGTKALTANAHNGYIDIWLELGFVGLALVLAIFGVFAFKAAAAIRRTRDPVYLWFFGALGFVLVYYVTESGALGYNDLGWFLVVYGFVALCAQEVRERTARARLAR